MKLLSAITAGLAVLDYATSYPFESYFGSTRVIQLSKDTVRTVSEDEKLSFMRKGIKFMDITNNFLHLKNNENLEDAVPRYNYPSKTLREELVNTIIENIDKSSMEVNLAKFTSFYTRYYKSETGYQSAQWLEHNLLNITSGVSADFVSVERVIHPEWKQYSIIVKVLGSETPENIVVMGSHQDSINLILPSVLAAPGADDNGSGTVTNLEALRLYVEHYLKKGNRPKNTIEFHFYSAEEGGLLGSLDVFSRYASEHKRVVAMLQQDMTGYVQDPENEHVGVITDYVNSELTDFIKVIVNSYLSIPYVETKCGYACSDHGSATRNGYPSAFVIESDFKKTNKYIHSTMDTLDRLSFDHMAEHTKIVIGSIIELGDWSFLELK
ncbi:hypothetical protein TPHA_0J03040 [Tetrapisispora phaffii CBS 4417]|uniref:Peptide hydrolase n=1 Tax=Tetrapisispora phaffii (strain ATCC 24235 / CBS 4417 / NBRC 1672 / NRRL Y-8282 / UCD 70-5) TaxID=1071381 RepID=G8BY73_TETPH|nr:hypothetical protein TPHA_0J03040 [Tetrapisispora phaffii CBS 4417]CCE65124.1 hypothetical protein TPHA_0J03040 [Tetrapisispora phaffii CBS 4417]